MLNHDIRRQSGECVIRPMLESDEENVLKLWNQDWVIGPLWSSRTSRETYRSRFETYKSNPDEYQCVVEKPDGTFVGTVGFRRIDAETSSFMYMALYPGRGFPAAVPFIMLMDYIFNTLHANRALFRRSVANEKIKKVFVDFRCENTGQTDTVVSRYGVESTREFWQYERLAFNANKDYFAETFGVQIS